jgi:hypothetical protein
VNIRLTGTADEVDATVELLKQVLDVREVSRFYPNRGDSKLGRRYIEADAPAPARTVRAHAVRADRPELTSRQFDLEER